MILFWIVVIALSILAYVLLDGFDLGVGILFAFTRDEKRRRAMLATISPVWDGNETWLVVVGTLLFGAFPIAYAALLSAFYLPLIFMLVGLILRGVAFEFRYKATTSRWLWDGAFWVGSFIAAFFQGVTTGALVQGIPMDGVHFAGGTFFWLQTFPMLCGIGLCAGYALLGAAWLAGKSTGDLHAWMQQLLPYLLLLVAVSFLAAFFSSLQSYLSVLNRWSRWPIFYLVPATGVIAGVVLITDVLRKRDRFQFLAAAALFATAYLTLAISIWPYLIPFSLTIEQAASPPSSLRFMFWGAGIVALPLTVAYTAFTYHVFKGRTLVEHGHYE